MDESFAISNYAIEESQVATAEPQRICLVINYLEGETKGIILIQSQSERRDAEKIFNLLSKRLVLSATRAKILISFATRGQKHCASIKQYLDEIIESAETHFF